MKIPILSVIIPMYNAYLTIERCIDSLLNQQNSDLIEIIVVDDCSKDDSFSLVNKKYSNRIVLLRNDRNRGPSFSRNKGIKEAKGTFLTFVDSDDYVANNYIEKIISMTKCDFDICFFNFYKNKKITNDFPINRKEQLLFLFKNNLFGFSCNKIVKKSIILDNNIFFKEDQNMCEDQLFCFQYIQHCKKLIFIKDQLYYYIQHANSLANREHSVDLLLTIYLQKKAFFVKENLLNELEGKKIFSNYCLEMLLEMKTKNNIVYQDLREMKLYMSFKNKLRYVLKVQLKIKK